MSREGKKWKIPTTGKNWVNVRIFLLCITRCTVICYDSTHEVVSFMTSPYIIFHPSAPVMSQLKANKDTQIKTVWCQFNFEAEVHLNTSLAVSINASWHNSSCFKTPLFINKKKTCNGFPFLCRHVFQTSFRCVRRIFVLTDLTSSPHKALLETGEVEVNASTSTCMNLKFMQHL